MERLLAESDASGLEFVTAETVTIMRRYFMQANGTSKSDASPLGLPADISVSVVIATYDRPYVDAFVL